MLFRPLVLNSGYSPFLPFNILWFVLFEILTVVIETVVLWRFGGRWLWVLFDDGSNESFDILDAFILSCVMNFVSALVALPIWWVLGVGV